MDFLLRAGTKTDSLGKTYLNKKAIEVLIKTGAFDHTGEATKQNLNRPTLLANYEDAMSYASDIQQDKLRNESGLFGDFAEEFTYDEFKYKMIDDLPQMDLLNMEKECIGCYVSGHPLDSYRKAYERAVTVKSSTIVQRAKEAEAEKRALMESGLKPWQMRNTGKLYTALGMVSQIHIHRTKKDNKEMAFCKLNDFDGEMDCTFFTKEWEMLKGKITDGGIYAFRGKLDGSRDTPSLLVSSIEDPTQLESQSIQAIHISLDSNFSSEAAITGLRDFLFDKRGNCSVYFHIDTGAIPFIIKANNQLSISSDKEVLDKLKDVPFVKEVWTE